MDRVTVVILKPYHYIRMKKPKQNTQKRNTGIYKHRSTIHFKGICMLRVVPCDVFNPLCVIFIKTVQFGGLKKQKKKERCGEKEVKSACCCKTYK